MKHHLIKKLFLSLVCVILIALPILFIDSKPLEVSASSTYTASFKKIMECTDIDTYNSYVSDNSAAIGKEIKDFEIKYAIYHGSALLEAFSADENNAESSVTAAKNGFNSASAILDSFYQDTCLPAVPEQDEITYNIGSGNDVYEGVRDEGFTVSAGQNVTLHIIRPTFQFHGPITVKEGGVLNITLDSSVVTDTGSMLKREVEETLRVGALIGDTAENVYIDGVEANGYYYYYSDRLKSGETSFSPNNNSGYIPIDADDGIVSQYSGELFNISGGTLNITGREGRHIVISGAGQFTFNTNNIDENGNCITFPALYNTADDVLSKAPVIYINDPKNYETIVNINYVDIQYNNNAANSGDNIVGYKNAGAFNVSGEAPTVNISNSIIKYCRAIHQGGFMYCTSTVGGKVDLNSVNINNCYTDAANSTEGGTFRTLGSSHCGLAMTGCTFDKNYSRLAAGAFLWSAMEAGELVVKDCNITNNTSNTGTGGIICMGQMSIVGNTNITGNKSINGNGGGISFTNWASTTANSSFKLNFDANLNLGPGVVISGNSAGGYGGGIYISVNYIKTGSSTSDPITYYKKENGSDFEMRLVIDGATIKDNYSGNQGGGVYMIKASGCEYIADVTMKSGTVQNNTADGRGGAFYLSGKGVDFTMNNGTITGNNSGTNGGAICLSQGNFKMNDGTISNNEAETYGGAIFIENGGNATINKGEITGNKAGITQETTNSRGGAIYVNNGNVEISDGGNISGNSCIDQGGGIYLTGTGCTVTMNGGNLDSNTSNSGGGAYVYKGSFSVNNGTISGNEAKSSSGGGVVANLGSFTMSGSTVISNNTSKTSGGAVYVFSDGTTEASFHMISGTITQNTSSTQYGGAVYVNRGKFTIDEGIISYNTAAAQGGAIHVTGGDVIMNDGIITNNTSHSHGGAVYVINSGNFFMYNGTISENTTTSGSGAAININGGNVVMHNGEISGNISAASAGAIRMSNGGNFTMNGGSIKDNQCRDSGGAIYMEGGICTINGGEMSGNKTTGTDLSGGAINITKTGQCILNGGKISKNTTNVNGGAIYLSNNSSFTMYSGELSENKAGGSGGAVYVLSGNFNMTGGTVSANEATGGNGGAVYVSSGNFNMTGGTVSANEATGGSGGAVYVNAGNFNMTTGALGNNKALNGSGGAVCVSGGSVTIGASGCYGDANFDGHTSCPVISSNKAINGGAFAVLGGSPTIHCGTLNSNIASDEGGAMYVTDGNVTVNYVVMEHNEAVAGGGFSVYANTKNLSVTVDSGFIKYNTATNGGGIKVNAASDRVATVTVGREGCDGANNSSHKHPDISSNIAECEGGGLHLVSDSANGIVFTMWCGSLYQNIANGNIPTGNILQEGGTVSIHGSYAIDNVTVNNGYYLRPSLRPSYDEKNVTINFYYKFPVTVSNGNTALKSITLTVGEGSSKDMYINLPSYVNLENAEGKIMILLRWSESDSNNDVTYETGSKLVINDENFGEVSVLNLYGVWIAQGAGLAETPFVSAGLKFAHWDDGSSIATGIGVNGSFTVQFEVSDCNPAEFADRYLTFSDPLKAGTVVIMVDLTAESGVNHYYYHEFDGTETSVSIKTFTKLGSPNVTWTTNRSDNSGNSDEKFLFIFDLTGTEEAFTGGFWIALTREYVEADVAPMTQTVSCAINDEPMPSISVGDSEPKVGDSVTVNYEPGAAAESDSIYYGKQAALVIDGASETLPSEAYILVGNDKYPVSTSGVIIIPIGDAKNARSFSFKLVSPSLTNSESGISINARLYITDDNLRPMNSPNVGTVSMQLKPILLPSASISMDERIFYLDNLPESVALSVTTQNIEDYDLTVSVVKREFGDDTEYGETNDVIISGDHSSMTFADNIGEGTYRIIITVTTADGEDVLLTVNYNFVVLQS